MKKKTLFTIIMVMVAVAEVQAASVVERQDVEGTTEYSVDPTTLLADISTANQEETTTGRSATPEQDSEYSENATTETENQTEFSTEPYPDESKTSETPGEESNTQESLMNSEATTVGSVSSEERSQPHSKKSEEFLQSQSTSKPAFIPNDTEEGGLKVSQETKAEPIDVVTSHDTISDDKDSSVSSYATNATSKVYEHSDVSSDAETAAINVVDNSTENTDISNATTNEKVTLTESTDGFETDSLQKNTAKEVSAAGEVGKDSEGTKELARNSRQQATSVSTQTDAAGTMTDKGTLAYNETADKDTKEINKETITTTEATETDEYLRNPTELPDDSTNTTEPSEESVNTTESLEGLRNTTEFSERESGDSEQERVNSTLERVEEASGKSEESTENYSKESEKSAEANGSNFIGNIIKDLMIKVGENDKTGRMSNVSIDTVSVNEYNTTGNKTVDSLGEGSYNESSSENDVTRVGNDNATRRHYNARDAAVVNVTDDNMLSVESDEDYEDIDDDMSEESGQDYGDFDEDMSSEEDEEDSDEMEGDTDADEAEEDDFGEVAKPKRERGSSPGFARHLRRFSPRNSGITPWPNAVIPYVVWGSDKVKQRVSTALGSIQNQTCLNFTGRTSEKRYVVIKEDDGGCWASALGYPSSNKRVVVGLGRGCRTVKGITHEVLHAAGFVHEHNRPDRRDYIKIVWDNIKKSGRSGFRLDNKYADLTIPYDYKSIMHYGRKAFAKDRSKPTLIPLNPVSGSLGGSSLSPLDVKRINAFYNC